MTVVNLYFYKFIYSHNTSSYNICIDFININSTCIYSYFTASKEFTNSKWFSICAAFITLCICISVIPISGFTT